MAVNVLRTGDDRVDRFQEQVRQAFKELASLDVLRGRRIENVDVTTSGVTLQHGLGRKLLGWTLVRMRADARVWDLQDSNQTPDKTLVLKASAPATVDLWVF